MSFVNLQDKSFVFDEIKKIWESVLGLEITADLTHKNFFQLGGNSMQALQIISRLKEVFSINISLKSFLSNANIVELSELICNNF